ncbi:MAG: hypothetical protein EPN82_09295 [Bacteroidetes bacterium]|nr:MAG: hypothetical protein EPN82_09295 [Bacteroidota bacterium]
MRLKTKIPFRTIKRNSIFLLTFILVAFAISAGEPKYNKDFQTKIDYLIINKDTISKETWNDIVISQKDTITFIYHCEAKDTSKPFLFNIKLQNEDDINIRSSRSRIALYFGLPEGKYDLTIYSFSQRWTSYPAFLKFEVNNKEDSLRNEIEKLKKANTSLIEKKGDPSNFVINKSHLLIGLIVIPVLAGIIIIMVKFKKRKKLSESYILFEPEEEINQKIYLEDEKMEIPTPTPASEKPTYDELFMENQSFKDEIEALRAQINVLQSRSYELNKQNKELEEKAEKLSKGKKELEDLQKQKDELFAVIIHDIKNPVALIKSLVELLRSYDLTATEQQEIIDDIFETTTKIVSLSQEVSRILSLESTAITLNLEQYNINEILNDVFRRNSVASKSKNISMLLDLGNDIPQIELDYQKVDEIIDNLISNAIKFSHSGGEIRIKSINAEDNVVVEISDNGLGLSEIDIQKAFQRGARLSAKPTANEPSSGLGLWIVRKLVEAHNGRVWVRSALGKGSTFAFALPVTSLRKGNGNGK